MSDFFNDTAAANTGDSGASASTSAPSDSTAPSSEAAEPLISLERDTPFEQEDAWADFGKKDVSDAATKENETTAVEPDKPAPKSDKEPKTDEKAEEKPDNEQDDSAVEEDEVLADLFGKAKEKDETETALTDEMIKALRPAAQAAAKRNERKAELVKDFQYADKPITEVMSRLEELSPQRFQEMRSIAAQDLLDADPEAFFRRAYAVKMLASNPNFDYRTAQIPSLDDIISGTFGAQDTNNQVNAADELADRLGFDYRDPANDDFLSETNLEMVRAIRALEADKAALIKKGEGQSEEFKTLQKQAEDIAQEGQRRYAAELNTTMESVVNEFRTSIESKLLPLIAENTGLTVKPDDSPSIKSFKERKMELYAGTDYEKANNQSSTFENFAYYASSVKDEFMKVFDRLAPLHETEARAKLSGNAAALQKTRALINETRIPLFTLYTKANEEFKTRFIAPDMELLGSLGKTISQNINTAKQRVEVVSSGAQTRADTPQPEYDSADDVWDAMVTNAQKNQQLRTGA
jgi:hypothetical protein